MKTHKILSILILLFGFNLASCQNMDNPELARVESKMVPFAQGLSNTTSITHAGDNLLFVVDQKGLIRIVDSNGNVNPQPFLDIQNKVTTGGERGLLGLAFHPKYNSNGYFYVNYVGESNITHISRFKVNSSNENVADSQSEFVLLTVPQPFTNHNGGNLSFGPDGFLYIGLGDGGGSGDPNRRAQNPMEYLGKILRIDVDQGNPYAIPSSNPFYNSETALKEIWALGLRNPWRFSFDRLTGDLWIADVGQNEIEEINFQPSASKGGENYGWRCYEGNEPYSGNEGECQKSGLTFPVHTYTHSLGCSVSGGFVYRGSPSSEYYGHYFFADYCSNRIWTLHREGENWVRKDFGQYPGNNFATFGEDAQGQLYVAGMTSGTLFRVIDSATSSQSANVLGYVKVIQVPLSNRIHIETGRSDLGEIKITLSDMKGSLLFRGATSESSYEFDPGTLPWGTYLLNIFSNGNRLVHKLVKWNL